MMTIWTDRSRPVLERYEEWLKSIPPDYEVQRLEYVHHEAMLMHDLAAVLRESCKYASGLRAPSESVIQGVCLQLMARVRDPKTGERVFP